MDQSEPKYFQQVTYIQDGNIYIKFEKDPTNISGTLYTDMVNFTPNGLYKRINV